MSESERCADVSGGRGRSGSGEGFTLGFVADSGDCQPLRSDHCFGGEPGVGIGSQQLNVGLRLSPRGAASDATLDKVFCCHAARAWAKALGIDILPGPLDPKRPHIIFLPLAETHPRPAQEKGDT